ncbi:MAG: SPOR domain-containing protein [Lachnospiraceae bacterium]|nr:SPOR domain-containing protein [Lachnospiraceae bacterium]
MKRQFIKGTICFLAGLVLLGGCRKKAEEPAVDKPEVNTQSEQKPSEETNEGAAKPDADKPEKESLAKRMTGKYLFDLEDTDPESDECLIMNVFTFGDNLYAYCGQAMRDSGSIEAYSFWAAEFIPFDAEDLKSTDSSSVRVNELCFSIMSNAGKYWSKGSEGTITLKDEGLLFEGFDGGESRLFVRDDSVEDVFPYLNDNAPGDDDITGLWVTRGDGADIYIDVYGSNMTFYKKSPSEEVRFYKFGCEFDNGTFTGTGNSLGGGSMPFEISGKYRVNGDELILDMDDPEFIDGLLETAAFTRTDEKAIPVFTTDDIVFNEDSFGMYSPEGTAVPFLSSDYYGVFISAFKNRDDCLKTEMELEDAGYHLCPVVYTPDFSMLNPEPYYVVCAGIFTNELKADELLKEIKSDGFKDAYVKEAGQYIGDRRWYLLHGNEGIEVLKDCVILHDVGVTIPYMTDEEPDKYDLYVYEDAVFDSSAETQFFGNYEEGDTPYKWLARNYNLKTLDPDKYMESGPALSGIFEVGLDGSRIKTYYGSYWWD